MGLARQGLPVITHTPVTAHRTRYAAFSFVCFTHFYGRTGAITHTLPAVATRATHHTFPFPPRRCLRASPPTTHTHTGSARTPALFTTAAALPPPTPPVPDLQPPILLPLLLPALPRYYRIAFRLVTLYACLRAFTARDTRRDAHACLPCRTVRLPAAHAPRTYRRAHPTRIPGRLLPPTAPPLLPCRSGYRRTGPDGLRTWTRIPGAHVCLLRSAYIPRFYTFAVPSGAWFVRGIADPLLLDVWVWTDDRLTQTVVA